MSPAAGYSLTNNQSHRGRKPRSFGNSAISAISALGSLIVFPARNDLFEIASPHFVNHMSRLDYAGRLASSDAIGSGVVEGSAKALGLRLKAQGACWRHKNARAMAALICCRRTDQWDLF
jgi:hypothetical protein